MFLYRHISKLQCLFQKNRNSIDDFCLKYETSRIRICNHIGCSEWSRRYDIVKGTQLGCCIISKYPINIASLTAIYFYLFSLKVPSSSFPLTIHETPPNVIQVDWKNPINEHVDYFELSIKNLSSSEDDIHGNTVILTNIRGKFTLKKHVEQLHKIWFYI